MLLNNLKDYESGNILIPLTEVEPGSRLKLDSTYYLHKPKSPYHGLPISEIESCKVRGLDRVRVTSKDILKVTSNRVEFIIHPSTLLSPYPVVRVKPELGDDPEDKPLTLTEEHYRKNGIFYDEEVLFKLESGDPLPVTLVRDDRTPVPFFVHPTDTNPVNRIALPIKTILPRK